MIDPLHGDGYQFWSGIGGAVLIPLVYRAASWLSPPRCSELGCHRIARRKHPLHGDPVCERHLP